MPKAETFINWFEMVSLGYRRDTLGIPVGYPNASKLAPLPTVWAPGHETFVKFKRPEVPGHEAFVKFKRPEVPGHETFVKFKRPEMLGLRAHPSARLSIAPLFHVWSQESTMESIHLL